MKILVALSRDYLKCFSLGTSKFPNAGILGCNKLEKERMQPSHALENLLKEEISTNLHKMHREAIGLQLIVILNMSLR